MSVRGNSLNELVRQAALLDCRMCGAAVGTMPDVTGTTSVLRRAVLDGGRAAVESRVADMLMAVMVAARRMGVADVESVLERRVREIEGRGSELRGRRAR